MTSVGEQVYSARSGCHEAPLDTPAEHRSAVASLDCAVSCGAVQCTLTPRCKPISISAHVRKQIQHLARLCVHLWLRWPIVDRCLNNCHHDARECLLQRSIAQDSL